MASSCALKDARFLGQTEDGLVLKLTGVQGAKFLGQTEDSQVLEFTGVYSARFLGQIEGGRVLEFMSIHFVPLEQPFSTFLKWRNP